MQVEYIKNREIRKQAVFIALILLCLFIAPVATAQKLERVSPESVGISSDRLKRVDEVIDSAIAVKQVPGAVLAIVKAGKMAYIKAYGNKSLYPSIIKMDENTIFDLASLTKPIATATAAMILIEQGKLRLIDRVDLYIPDFQPWMDGKRSHHIRIVDLLTHTSGLPAYAPVGSIQKEHGAPNPDALIDYVATCKRVYEPLTQMRYSCLNFITLQRIIETIAGEDINKFTHKNIFEPLDMKHTTFNPGLSLYPLIAPTERQKDGSVLLGKVHDPLARVLNGGVSGNAGLFSNADDLAIFIAAILNAGTWNDKTILSPSSIKVLQTVPKEVEKYGRALGWDVSSAYASNQGDLLSEHTFGHTGFTGTSLVIDPEQDLGIIFLTNSIHPKAGASMVRLRSLVTNVVAAALLAE